VVVGQTNLLLLGLRGSDGDRVRPGVLNLLDEVLVTLLGETPALLRVEVHIVTPDVDAAGGVVKSELAGEVEIETDLVVLEGDEGKVQPGVPVEEEQEGEVDLVRPTNDSPGGSPGGIRGELGIVGLLVSGQVKLGVQPPPNLVVLVDALTADGELNVLDGALGSPAPRERPGGRNETSKSGEQGVGLELEEHVADKIAVTGNGDGQTPIVTGRPVHSLLDDLHRKVRVALVDRLEKGNLGVTSKVDILSTVSNKLHQTTSHFILLANIFFQRAKTHTIISGYL